MDEVLRCFGPICDPTGNPHRAQAEQRLQELSRQAGILIILLLVMVNITVLFIRKQFAQLDLSCFD